MQQAQGVIIPTIKSKGEADRNTCRHNLPYVCIYCDRSVCGAPLCGRGLCGLCKFALVVLQSALIIVVVALVTIVIVTVAGVIILAL